MLQEYDVLKADIHQLGADPMRDYPEHEKLYRMKKELGTEHIGQFLEWLAQTGIVLAEWEEETRWREDQLIAHNETIEKLLARYAGVDLEVLEAEKRQMLADLRVEHARDEIERALGLREKR